MAQISPGKDRENSTNPQNSINDAAADNNESSQADLNAHIPRIGYDKITWAAFFTILGGWCVLLIIGAQLAWGNQSTYIGSYFYMLGHNVHMDDFYMVQPLIVVIAMFFFPCGMALAEKHGAKIVMVSGGVFSLGLLWLISYVQNPAVFMMAYSFAFGVGKGLMYSSALQAGWSHLKGRIGLASGLIICGFGFGGFIFGIVSNLLCNPDNVSVEEYIIDGQTEYLFPKEVAENVPYMLRRLDLIYFCLLLFAACTVHTYRPPADSVDQDMTLESQALREQNLLDEEQKAALLQDEHDKLPTEERNLLEREKEAEENIPTVDILKTGKFGGLYALVVCHMYYGYYISNSYKQYGFTGGIDDRTLTLIGSAGALFNGCFKVFWATLLDYFHFKPVYSIVLCIQLSMLVWVHWAVNNSYAYFIVICLSFMCDGSMTSMIPVVANRIYGGLRGPTVYSYLYSTFAIASILGLLLVTTLQQPLGYHGMLLICLAFTSSSAIITFFYKFDRISYAELADKIGFEYFKGETNPDEKAKLSGDGDQNKGKESAE